MQQTTESNDPQIKLKVNIVHDVRNHDRSTPDVEQRVKRMLNHPQQKVTDIRIAVGHSAGAVFLTLIPGRHKDLYGLVRETTRWLERERYADGIGWTDYSVEAVDNCQEGEGTES